MSFTKKTVAISVISWLTIAASAPAMADDGKVLPAALKGKPCLQCHKVDHKIVGPAFKEVATKYKGQEDAEEKLIEKIKKGGSGNWGPMPMPAQTAIKDDELKKIVEWILSLS
jgi:cytochrome c